MVDAEDAGLGATLDDFLNERSSPEMPALRGRMVSPRRLV